MSIIWMIVLGLIVGFIAKLIVPGQHNLGLILTGLLGIVGSYVGGTLGNLLFRHEFAINPPIKHSFLGSLVGAVIVLLLYQLFTKRSAKR